jgi:hypothetical protein
MIKTAILVDGAFYRKRAYALFGDLTPSCFYRQWTHCIIQKRMMNKIIDINT